jgi:hypothetical protein
MLMYVYMRPMRSSYFITMVDIRRAGRATYAKLHRAIKPRIDFANAPTLRQQAQRFA